MEVTLGAVVGAEVDAVVVAPPRAEVSVALEPPWLEQARPKLAKETKVSSFLMKVSRGCRGSRWRRRAPSAKSNALNGRVNPQRSRRVTVGRGDALHRTPGDVYPNEFEGRLNRAAPPPLRIMPTEISGRATSAHRRIAHANAPRKKHAKPLVHGSGVVPRHGRRQRSGRAAPKLAARGAR